MMTMEFHCLKFQCILKSLNENILKNNAIIELLFVCPHTYPKKAVDSNVFVEFLKKQFV